MFITSYVHTKCYVINSLKINQYTQRNACQNPNTVFVEIDVVCVYMCKYAFTHLAMQVT